MYKIALVSFTVVFCLISCKSSYYMSGKVYAMSDYEQEIKISFISDSICIIEQSFKCDKISDSLKFTKIQAKYDILKSEINYLHNNNKRKKMKVNYLRLINLNPKNRIENYSIIPNYNELCGKYFDVNSYEMKTRQKVTSGVIHNLVNDSLLIKRDTIFFGYKRVPFVGNVSKLVMY